MYLWPRLGPASTNELLTRVRTVGRVDLRAVAESVCDDVLWYPTGNRVPTSTIEAVASMVRTHADKQGWPSAPSRDQSRVFDQQIAGPLHQMMEIVPGDAAHPGVWGHLALVVLPDIAAWRWGGRADERFVDRTDRNVFGRLWWRAHRFGDGPDDPTSRLGEDQSVGIIERPSIAGRRRLARTLAQAVADHSDSSQELMREAAKYVRGQLPLLETAALDDAGVTRVVGSAIAAAEAASDD